MFPTVCAVSVRVQEAERVRNPQTARASDRAGRCLLEAHRSAVALNNDDAWSVHLDTPLREKTDRTLDASQHVPMNAPATANARRKVAPFGAPLAGSIALFMSLRCDGCGRRATVQRLASTCVATKRKRGCPVL